MSDIPDVDDEEGLKVWEVDFLPDEVQLLLSVSRGSSAFIYELRKYAVQATVEFDADFFPGATGMGCITVRIGDWVAPEWVQTSGKEWGVTSTEGWSMVSVLAGSQVIFGYIPTSYVEHALHNQPELTYASLELGRRMIFS